MQRGSFKVVSATPLKMTPSVCWTSASEHVCVCLFRTTIIKIDTLQPLGSKQDIPNFISCVEVY